MVYILSRIVAVISGNRARMLYAAQARYFRYKFSWYV